MKLRESEKWLIVGAVGLFLLATLIIPLFKITAEPSERVKTVAALKEIVIALRAYASDWEDGRYPDTLDELYPDYLDDESLLTAVGTDGERRPWIYQGGKTDSSLSRGVLIEYPFPINGRRIVGFTGGHVSEMPVDGSGTP